MNENVFKVELRRRKDNKIEKSYLEITVDDLIMKSDLLLSTYKKGGVDLKSWFFTMVIQQNKFNKALLLLE